jgi:hypothetical protein
MPDQINPYAPVDIDQQLLDDAASEVHFRLTKARLRHGEDHFLLHAHPMRLLFCSLAMIFASGAAFVWASRVGTGAFAVTAVAALGISTLIYLALVHHTKIKIRRRLREHGLLLETTASVKVAENQLIFTGSSGQHSWPKEDVTIYRTPRGTLLCPEPLMFIYVPRNNNSPREAYKTLRKSLQTA